MISKSQIVTDYDGNQYQSVSIGNQIWMTENLRTTHYSDGSPIADGTGIGDIESGLHSGIEDTTKRYFYYNDNPSNADNYGLLYSWYAAVRGTYSNNNNPSGIQGVCPSGWHIPSDNEWTELELCLGMDPGDTIYWQDRGTNQGEQLKPGGISGFNASLGGARDYDDFDNPNNYFGNKDIWGCYITSRTGDGDFCRIFVIEASSIQTHRWGHPKCCGYSVRCLKDSPATSVNFFTCSSIISLYPNPSQDYLYINSNDLKIEQINIFSFEGKPVKSIDSHGDTKISISDINKGLYIIKIYFNNNIYTDKLIIK